MQSNNNFFTVVLKGIPPGKQRAGKLKNGHFYNPQSDIMHIAQKIIKSNLPVSFVKIPREIPVTVNVTFFFSPAQSEKTKKFLELIKNDDYPYLKKPDRDNADKFVLDLLSGLVFYDDNQVYSGLLQKYYSTNPRTEIEISWPVN